MQEADKLELAAVIPVPCADTVTTPAVCHAAGCGRSHPPVQASGERSMRRILIWNSKGVCGKVPASMLIECVLFPVLMAVRSVLCGRQ